METKKYAFLKGFSQVQKKDLRKVKKRIMTELNLGTRQTWYNRLNGCVIPNVEEAEKLTKIFADFGIKRIWGDVEE